MPAVTAELRVLGAVEAYVDGEPVDLGSLRQRCVLAVLAIEANRVVSVDQLVDRVLGHQSPGDARSSLYSYLTRLRQALAGADDVAITRRPGGYLLTVDPAAVDLHLFHDLVARARVAGDARAGELLQQALALWRGDAFAAMDTPWLTNVRTALELQRWTAELDHVDRRLRQGDQARMVPELASRAEQYPLDERVAGQYLLALYRSGRGADALFHYQQTREVLADKLGAEPGAALKQLHQRILTNDPALAPAAVEERVALVPRQLPAPSPMFVGRASELAALTKALDEATSDGTTVLITAVGGVAGIGKTALALHWAHEHADRFPDGQFFVNLGGFDPSGEPVSPVTAVRGFLDALGVDPRSVPADVGAQAGLWRSLIAGRQMLIMLDNAADSSQLTPLLPGTPTCTVLITSRRRLTGLAVGGAQLVDLGVLAEMDARHLLAAHLGTERLAAEPDAVAELVRWCAGLPLALGIVAARAAGHPDFPLSALAEELHDAATRLDALDAGELSVNLRAVFDSSYRNLDGDTATLFGLLGIAPGPDLGLPAIASLLARSAARTRALLRQLEAASLVAQPTAGRYRMHDLVRLYAAEQAHSDISEADRAAAVRRLVDCYLHTAMVGDRLLEPHRKLDGVAPPVPGCLPEELADAAAALAWFDAEHPGLRAVQQLAADHGWHAPTWQLAWALHVFHWRRGYQGENVACWQTGLDAAQRLGDPAALTLTHRCLGRTHALVGRHAEALDHLRQALALAEQSGDTTTQAHVHLALAWACAGQDHPDQALTHAGEALALFESLGDPVWVAEALNEVAYRQSTLGHHDEARIACERALALARAQNHRDGEAAVLDSLGYVCRQAGEGAEAVDYFRQALEKCQEIDDAYHEADALDHLGDAQAALGQRDAARNSWSRAVERYRAQHRTADAERIEVRLADL